MIHVKDVLKVIEGFAPLSLQESYDNAGLIVGNENNPADSALLTVDITEDVIEEAVRKKINLIIAHHPIIFNGLKKITGRTYVERCVIKAIKNNISIIAVHTNIDSVISGVNKKICDKIGLTDIKILDEKNNFLAKLVTFIPSDYVDKVREAIFNAGAGYIGNYDNCGFNVEGIGSFRAGDNSNPFVGKIGETHYENEVRFETVFPAYLKNKIIGAMLQSHPYEEVAYDIYPLLNDYSSAGSGMVGKLKEPAQEEEFLKRIKKIFKAKCIKHTKLSGKTIEKVAVCGGSGSFLLNNAIACGANIFISADFRYHQFFDADDKIIIADIGHFESEQYTTEIFYDVLTKNLTNFAAHFSEINTNPINYL